MIGISVSELANAADIQKVKGASQKEVIVGLKLHTVCKKRSQAYVDICKNRGRSFTLGGMQALIT